MRLTKYLIAALAIGFVILVVLFAREQDQNESLKQELGEQCELRIESIRNYVQDIQSAIDSGESINTNHFYTEISNFPIKNQNMTAHFDDIHSQLAQLESGQQFKSKDRISLSYSLNKLQLVLTDIITYADRDTSRWHDIVINPNSTIQSKINKHYE